MSNYITNVQGPTASSPNDPNDYKPGWSFGQQDLQNWVNVGGNLISSILGSVAAFNLSKNGVAAPQNNNSGGGNGGNGGGGGSNSDGTDWTLFIVIGFLVLVLAVLVFLIIKSSK